MSVAQQTGTFSIREIRELTQDLFVHKPIIYWADLLATLTVGYGFAALYLRSPLFSVGQIVGFVISGFALFRAGSYIHEIVHMRQGEMLGFRLGWNILCGIPMLMPSFFYENHIDHHKSHHYGTERDGEYLPLGSGSLRQIIMFFAQVPVLPLYISLRFLLSPLTFVNPRVRNWVLEHMSSFVINFRHRLTIRNSAPRRVWALMELACCVRIWALVAVVVLSIYPWTRMVQLYALSMFVLGLNYVRNLVAHRYRNTGGEMTHLEQLEDSVNITGHWFWTELFFPLNLRYHALHHLIPSLPYHNLAKAHRRLMEHLPADSPYRRTVFPSYWSVVKALFEGQKETGSARDMATAA